MGFPVTKAELAARVTIAMQTQAERMTLSHRFHLHPKIVPVVVTVETCGAFPTALAVGSSIREKARSRRFPPPWRACFNAATATGGFPNPWFAVGI